MPAIDVFPSAMSHTKKVFVASYFSTSAISHHLVLAFSLSSGCHFFCSCNFLASFKFFFWFFICVRVTGNTFLINFYFPTPSLPPTSSLHGYSALRMTFDISCLLLCFYIITRAHRNRASQY